MQTLTSKMTKACLCYGTSHTQCRFRPVVSLVCCGLGGHEHSVTLPCSRSLFSTIEGWLEGWCAKQQEKDEGAAHPWASSKRGAAFGCIISLLNKAAIANSLSAPRNTELHPGWSKVGFAEMAKCKPAVWDSVLGSLKPIHSKHKEDKPWTWVATTRADAPSQFMDQFRAMSTPNTDGVITIAEERDNKQSKSEEQLWKWLKSRSKST